MGGWIALALQFLRKLSIARYIRPLWIGALKIVVQEGGDALQARIKEEIVKDLAGACHKIDPVFDKAAEKIVSAVGKLPLPQALEQKIIGEIKVGLSNLRDRIKAAIGCGSIGAVQQAIDAAFDNFQKGLIYRIEAL